MGHKDTGRGTKVKPTVGYGMCDFCMGPGNVFGVSFEKPQAHTSPWNAGRQGRVTPGARGGGRAA